MADKERFDMLVTKVDKEIKELNTALLQFAQAQKVKRALDTAMFKCWVHREHMKRKMPEFRSYSLVAGMIVLTA